MENHNYFELRGRLAEVEKIIRFICVKLIAVSTFQFGSTFADCFTLALNGQTRLEASN